MLFIKSPIKKSLENLDFRSDFLTQFRNKMRNCSLIIKFATQTLAKNFDDILGEVFSKSPKSSN